MTGVESCNSFTCNPHKMLGAKTNHLLCQLQKEYPGYLFDKRKSGADLDLGDKTFMC